MEDRAAMLGANFLGTGSSSACARAEEVYRAIQA